MTSTTNTFDAQARYEESPEDEAFRLLDEKLNGPKPQAPTTPVQSETYEQHRLRVEAPRKSRSVFSPLTR